MKLSFSTLGCPRWTWDEVFTTAKDLGFDGVEIRGLADKIYAPDIEAFSVEKIDITKVKLKEINLEIPILTSGATLAEPEKALDSFVEACDYINLASKLGAPYIRVMGTGKPHLTEGDFEFAAKLYKLLCEYGKLLNVTPLIETNGKLSYSAEILKFIEMSEAENCGILWDIHHTVRFAKEAPADTVKALGKYIRHVHVKDSSVIDDNIKYQMLGYGDIPVIESIAALKGFGYDGYLSLEWVKRWNPDLQEPGVVFAHYASFMNRELYR